MKQKFVVLGVCVALLSGCSAPAEEETVSLRSVEVTTLGRDTISSDFTYSGKAAAATEISVATTISGEVINYYFEVGDNVSKGQTLFTVDPSSLQDQLRSAQATYKATELSVQNAETTYNNNLTLYNEGIIAKAEMDQIRLSYETAVAQLEAQKISIETLEKNIADCSVTSPITGVVTARNVEAGGFASQAAVAYTVMDLSTIKVEVGVSEQTVNTISVGDSVLVYMSAVSTEPLTGTVATISPAASQTGTYTVKVELPNSDGMIKSGMLAQVSFTKESVDDAQIIPRDALLTRDGEDFIYTVENNTVKKVVVETGVDTGEYIQIVTELPEGTQVVTRGQTYVSDGEEVQIINQDGSSSDSNTADTPTSAETAPEAEGEEE